MQEKRNKQNIYKRIKRLGNWSNGNCMNLNLPTHPPKNNKKRQIELRNLS